MKINADLFVRLVDDWLARRGAAMFGNLNIAKQLNER
jgi:hypothetical protein